ncbi:MAG: hypothetical protein ACI9OJ_001512 [Myxococcota bacterium]|jgi:hypothetical protein
MLRTFLFPRLMSSAVLGVVVFSDPISASAEAVVSPSVEVLKHFRGASPAIARAGIFDPAIVNTREFSGSIRFTRVLTDAECQTLMDAGVRFTSASNARFDHVGPVYPARIAWKALNLLRQDARVVQIDSEPLNRPVRPLEVTRGLVDADRVADRQRLTGERPGEGMVIVDIDSGIDVFHPAFFHADGGHFAWLDVNGDGTLTFGTDAIDFNNNGEADSGETVRFVDAPEIDLGLGLPMPSESFDFGLDWIYADSNGNAQRDFGPSAGFDDSSPGFGEPIFLADDVDGNGVLGLDEKLVLLKSSKIKAVRIDETVYSRGENLTAVPTLAGSIAELPEESHGTGVSGILVAGTPGLSRHVGLAPYADVIMISNRSAPTDPDDMTKEPLLTAIAWVRDLAPDVMLYEFSTWGADFMDGSTNLEIAMDDMHWNDRISQVVPAGNLANSGKHMSGTLTSAGIESVVDVPKKWQGGVPFQTTSLRSTFYWVGLSTGVTLEIEVPTGEIATVAAGYHIISDELSVFCSQAKSTIGFNMLFCAIFEEDGGVLTAGTWRLRLKSQGGQTAIQGFLNDAKSGWARGAVFENENPATTLCVPSTANTAISVAAYGGRFGEPAELGALRDYSSRGPRMDGENGIDIVAPDDPFAPMPSLPAGTFGPFPAEDIHGGWSVFGGTSGAGPHVAAVVALMKQANPGWVSEKITSELRLSTRVSDEMGPLPNPEWGYGTLDAHRAVYGGPAPANDAPTAAAVMTDRVGLMANVTAVGSSDPNAHALSYRWDFDYDGTPDSEWNGSPEIQWEFPTAGRHVVKVNVRDELGAMSSALLSLEVADDATPVEPTVEQDPEADAGSTTDGAGTTTGSAGGADDSGSGGCAVNSSGGPLPAVIVLLLIGLAMLRRRTDVSKTR